jgi:hypothetical protein
LTRTAALVVAFLAAVSGGQPVAAQEAGSPVAAVASQTTFPLAELPFECRDFRGQKVVVQLAAGLGDVARARILFRIAYIQLDPDRMARLPPKMQIFFYGHECAHHVLGHNVYPVPTVEVDADCWSVAFGRDRGYFTREDVAAFKPYLEHSKGSAVGHLPGPARAEHLLKCWDGSATFARHY